MSSMLEQLWPVFTAEVGEKLDTLEAMVTKAASQNHSTGDSHAVDALFREFHTLKSNLSMVDFKEPMEIANACEDILHGLRKSKTHPSQEILDALLESVDWIKKQMAEAAPGQYPRTSNEALHKKLAPFRQKEESSTAERTPTEKAEDAEKSNIAEQKEALAIDTLRISSSSLDALVTQITQLILTEHSIDSATRKSNIDNAIYAVQQLLKNGGVADTNFVTSHFETLLNSFSDHQKALQQIDANIKTISDNLQANMLSLRAIPLSTIFTRLPRIVRQKASTYQKTVQLFSDGGDIAIDKSMVDIIAEPIIHLLHNAVVHGLESADERKAKNKPETGKIHISAKKNGDTIQIDIQDDGRGIDHSSIREKAISKGLTSTTDEAISSQDHSNEFWLNFLFSHGFSADIPNRTTGLDVVRDNLLRIGGSITIKSILGSGTCFTMRIPITVAIQNTLVIQAESQRFAIPLRQVVEIIEVTPDQIETAAGFLQLNLRGNLLPVYALKTLLQLNIEPPETHKKMLLVVLQHEKQYIALLVDSIDGKQDLFLRNVHQDILNIPGISGISLLGNGNAIIILDCEGLFRLTQHHVEPLYVAQ